MSASQDTDDGSTVTGVDRKSIGARLSAARTERKLDRRAVANELHLDVRTIDALENDDKAELPAAIFVKGYLRNYARLVGLPEDEIVRDFAEQSGDPPPLTVVSINDRTPFFRLPSARLLRNIILLLLAIILLWLAYPFVERLIQSRGQEIQQVIPGRLELPPADPQATE
jgi:cytoskeletal protein RodZ